LFVSDRCPAALISLTFRESVLGRDLLLIWLSISFVRISIVCSF
jgi:hypothetical protein